MKNIHQKIDDAFGSIEGIGKAEPAPFLLTRIHAALAGDAGQEANVWSSIASFLKRPAVAFTILIVLLFVNIIVLGANGFLSERKGIASATAAGGKYDIAVNVASMYDTENQEP